MAAAWCRLMAVPGHDGAPVAAAARGGARGCIQRSKVSMTRMRPPQHGQGGRGSGGSTAPTGSDRRRDGQQFAGAGDVGLAGGAGEQAVVADAVEAAGQDVQQEAADELVACRAS